jgi:hypothetical protein
MSNIYVSYITSSSELSPDYSHFFADATNDNILLTIPEIIADGQKICINKINNASNTVTIEPFLGNTINVGANIVLAANESATLISFNNVWYRV